MRCPNCDTPIHNCIDISDLSPRHIAALELFVAKFKKGAIEHVDLEPNKDWTRDILDETVDEAFYRIFQLLNMI